MNLMAKSLSFPAYQFQPLINRRYFPLLQRELLYPYKYPPSHPHHSSLFLRNHFPPKCQNPSNPSSPSSTPAHQQEQEQEQHLEQLKDTQEAISLFLQGFGVSLEDSISIATNSPKYANMLVDSVKDLEEWSSWKSGDAGGEEFGRLKGFKEKVVHMAKVKGDNGKVAFLESIGLNLSSSMNVARYLSKESLRELIDKVKYMKEIFYTSSDDKILFGKKARRMMGQLSIPIDEDLQQTLSFFEKIEARRGGLDMLGFSDASFRYLVESFPRILSLPIDSHLKPMVQFLESIGISPKRMGNIFLLFPPTILWGAKGIRSRVKSFRNVETVDKSIGKVLVKYPWVLSSGMIDNYREILSFFDVEKVPRGSVERAIQSWPHILGCSPGKLKVMVEQFGEFGVRAKKLGQVIATSPQLLLRKPSEFVQVVTFFKDLGFTQDDIGMILSRCPEIFALSVDRTLRKKIESLATIGIYEVHLPRVIKKYPELLVSDFSSTLLPRMKYLMEIGISKRDVAFMVRRFSPLLGYSIDKVLRPKYEFLVQTMEKPVRDVVEYPRYFSYSLEKKIEPRFLVLKQRNIECSLKDMLAKNNDEFDSVFVHSEAGMPASDSPPSEED